MKNSDALILFAKAPASETVKTRLRKHLPDEERIELYSSLLEGTVKRLSHIPGVDSCIAYHPEEARGYFSSFGLPLFPQSGTGLGQRMHQALTNVLAKGYERAALVGVDIPDLTSDHILKALGLLATSDLVFGPTLDGGYYLVALKRPVREIFTGIRWSSPETLRESVTKAEGLGLRVSYTDMLRDMDTIDDVRFFRERTLRGKGNQEETS